jgi:hypothetical protein
MSASGWPANELVNKGFIMNRPEAGGAQDRDDAWGGRTFIVTGLQRSGTSLVASILRQVGIFMGAEINDSVHEDEAVVAILDAGDREGLKQLIAERDATYGTWGFKFPMICEALAPEDIALFTNPHIIVPFRDPVSIAVRQSLSDYQQPLPALRSAIDALGATVAFLHQLQCPTLLLSYEKSLVFPADFVDAIMRFCGLPQSDMLRARLIGLIEPNRRSYIDVARRRFDGSIDGVFDGCLHGWCRLTGSADPVALDLFADEVPMLAFSAGAFRQDLLDAGLKTGHHGFAVDLGQLNLRADAVIRIRVAVHGIELDNSGRRLEAYRR